MSSGHNLVFLLLGASALYSAPLPSNARLGVAFVGSKVCAGCHQQIYQTYIRTAMGRSVTRPSTALIHSPVTVHSNALNRDFRVFREGDDLYQSESESNGAQTVFDVKYKLEYVIGSGENGMSFAIRRGDYLFQAPLSYYSAAHKWDLSPGFEQSDPGFSRPIYDACIVCHAGRPKPVKDRDGLYRDPPFSELAVGCENCHGPGQLHIEEKGRGVQAGGQQTIVNPARLESRLAEDICMMCHQGGDARILLPGRDYGDFRPGTPLIQTLAIVSLPLANTQTDLLSHNVSMKLSKCFRASAGKLSCLTCHDPHQQPTPDAAPAFYRQRCLTCHTSQSFQRNPLLSRTHRVTDNCIGCHMPKRDVLQISHSALTNHRIPSRPDDLPASFDFSEAKAPELPGLLLLNRRIGEPELPLLVRLIAYGELAARQPGLLSEYQRLLNEASLKLPDNAVVLAALGRRSLLRKQSSAIDFLSRALAAGTPAALTFGDLSEALVSAGRIGESESVLEQGVTLYPFSKDLRKRLILSYIHQKQYDKARTGMEAYVRDFPEDAFLRGLLQRISESR